MTYRLVVAREARSRLNALRRDDARAARLVGEAVTALLEQGPRLGPPLVVPVGADLRAGEPREALDYWYQRQLTLLTKVRRAVAEAAACRRQLDHHTTELTKQARRLADLGAQAAASGRGDLAREAKDHWSAVRHQQVLLGEARADVREREAALLGISRRVQNQVDLFRSRRAGVEAVQRAGRAQQGAHEACCEADGAADADAAPCAAADGAVAKARAVACDMVTEAERLERAVEEPLGARPSETELYELRLRALTGRDLRVLCTVETGKAAGGTGAAEAVALLAVAADRTQWWEWYEYALPLARKRLARRESAGRGPGAEDENFCGGGNLLRDWYPGRDEDRHRGAASLMARNRGQRLASVRRHRGLTQEQVAARMGVPAARVAAVEEGEPGAVEVCTLAAYVAALSGRLEIVAEFDTERLVLG
ncbi:phage shock protein A [Streptomyces chrestomyceticus JCM 4735]|uniref:Phage shock protein A n=1 Tax=Streptomyces chrestomyceticus JCM 4735 TaxID=1306181 RepID=A0A7U9L2S2_9ACTN|nr:helix-turn-helix domain-containing protein [Streptomyces chrestomyceticus]GCD39960.1 phage shock protein A [Streptomyces chrestomyceticus JCM 4735]